MTTAPAPRRWDQARFHISKLLGEGVDKVRRAEHRQLTAQGDTRLKGTKYCWLESPENMMLNWYGHRVSSAFSEGINSLVSVIKSGPGPGCP